MHGKSRLLILAVLLALVAPGAPAQRAPEGWTTKSALKKIDAAMKGVEWLEGRVEWEEVLETQRIEGQGKIWVDVYGRIRGEVEGNNPRTVIIAPPRVHRYTPHENEARSISTVVHRDLLAQYVLVGFAPAGSAMKKEYEVTLARGDKIDGRDAFLFVLTPKTKVVRDSIPFLELWVDVETWMPSQLRLRHANSEMSITVRYQEIAPVEELSTRLFLPIWPEGTTVIKP